jgi:predicted nucleic acid-binding protein
MVLADTSAWIEYLRASGSAIDRRVEALLLQDRLATTDVVLAEVLMGARDARHAGRLEALLARGRHLGVRPLFDYESAATIYRACRRGGFSPRSLADCLIVAVAVHHGVPLLHADRDFDRMAQFVPLLLDE